MDRYNERIGNIMSGLTEEYKKLYITNLDTCLSPMEWEDIASVSSTSDLLLSLQEVPVYWYVMNYLMDIYRENSRTRKEQVLFDKWKDAGFKKDFFEYIRKVNDKECNRKNFADSEYEKLIKVILGYMKKDSEIFYPKARVSFKTIFDTPSQNMKKLKNLFELALIVNMPVETFEEFMKKGLKRSGFNYYSPEEAIMYCVLKYGQTGTKRENYDIFLECYSRLKKNNTGERYEYTSEIKNGIDEILDRNEDYSQVEEESWDAILEELEDYQRDFSESLRSVPADQDYPDENTYSYIFQKEKELEEAILKLDRCCLPSFEEMKKKQQNLSAKMESFEAVMDDSEKKKAYQELIASAEILEGVIESLDSYVLSEDAAVKIISKEMMQILQTLKNSEPNSRTILNVYQQLKEKAIFMNARDILSYDQQTDWARECGRGKVRITYNGEETEIPENTIFYFVDNPKSADAAMVEVRTTSKTILPETGKISTELVEIETLLPEYRYKKYGEGLKKESNGDRIIAETGTVFYHHGIPGIISISLEKRLKAFSEEARLRSIKVKDSKLFRFLYSEIEDNEENNGRKKLSDIMNWNGEPCRITKDMLGSWFLDTKFGDPAIRTRNEKSSRQLYISRNEILTLAFLAFLGDSPLDRKEYRKALKDEHEKYKYEDTITYFEKQFMEYTGVKPEPEDIYDYFTDQVDKVMNKCGMEPFDMANPYDCLLAYLILSDEPINTLRQLWRIALE